MASLNDLRKSKFLKKEDVGEGALVTVRRVAEFNVAVEGAEPEMKWGLEFDELDKPLICNSTNGQIIAKITGKDHDIETAWVGAKLVLYSDPNISFGGKLVGGIRVREPKKQAAQDLPF
jgi:hypothetical protein